MNYKQWHTHWVCECGKRTVAGDGMFFQGSDLSGSRFMAFGFHHLCPGCGVDIGDGGRGNPERQTCRLIPVEGYKRVWWNPLTWQRPHRLQVRRDNGDLEYAENLLYVGNPPYVIGKADENAA